ncbi:YlmG-like protein 2, chloroplastic [Dichanthelium oligosanthes]|uniref:YlmG-like protein 2, chloroplastic n=1 Tax=Dichanthelium oligosanthes TaxID=888268 RepID=A0A1E5UUF1_9POAL|nr:YlmG-like protein 2, chloroplastic [Dichanthelium oligosanthes]
MASPNADPPQHHASTPPLLLAVRHIPFPGVHRPRVLPAPDILAPLARRLEELASAAAAHPLLKPLFAVHSHLSSFSQSRRQLVAARRREALLSGEHCFAAVLGDSVAGVVVANGINNFLSLYNTVLVVRLVLTWFPNTPPAIVAPLSTICDPYLNIFRGIIPPLGGTLDLSPILAFLVLNVFTSTAAALPAELPDSAAAPQNHRHRQSGASASSCSAPLDLTANQRKWMQRMQSRKSQGGDGDH